MYRIPSMAELERTRQRGHGDHDTAGYELLREAYLGTDGIISFRSSQSGVRAGVCRMICIHPCALSSSPSVAPPVLARDSTLRLIASVAVGTHFPRCDRRVESRWILTAFKSRRGTPYQDAMMGTDNCLATLSASASRSEKTNYLWTTRSEGREKYCPVPACCRPNCGGHVIWMLPDPAAFLGRLVTTTACDKARQLTIHNDTCWMRWVGVVEEQAERQKKQLRGRDQCERREPMR